MSVILFILLINQPKALFVTIYCLRTLSQIVNSKSVCFVLSLRKCIDFGLEGHANVCTKYALCKEWVFLRNQLEARYHNWNFCFNNWNIHNVWKLVSVFLFIEIVHNVAQSRTKFSIIFDNVYKGRQFMQTH